MCSHGMLTRNLQLGKACRVSLVNRVVAIQQSGADLRYLSAVLKFQDLGRHTKWRLREL